jgi:hypothetical protein
MSVYAMYELVTYADSQPSLRHAFTVAKLMFNPLKTKRICFI